MEITSNKCICAIYNCNNESISIAGIHLEFIAVLGCHCSRVVPVICTEQPVKGAKVYGTFKPTIFDSSAAFCSIDGSTAAMSTQRKFPVLIVLIVVMFDFADNVPLFTHHNLSLHKSYAVCKTIWVGDAIRCDEMWCKNMCNCMGISWGDIIIECKECIVSTKYMHVETYASISIFWMQIQKQIEIPKHANKEMYMSI